MLIFCNFHIISAPYCIGKCLDVHIVSCSNVTDPVGYNLDPDPTLKAKTGSGSESGIVTQLVASVAAPYNVIQL